MEILRAFLALGLWFCGAAAFAADSGFYFGALGGRAEYGFDSAAPAPMVVNGSSATVVPDLNSFVFEGNTTAVVAPHLRWPADAEDEANAWGATAGYRIFRFAAVELSYLDLGTLRRSELVYTILPTPSPFLRSALQTRGLAASALGLAPLSEHWDLYVRAGALYAEMESKVSYYASPRSASSDSTSLLWGGGVQFNWGAHWSARLDFQRFLNVGESDGAAEADIDLLTLGILYRL